MINVFFSYEFGKCESILTEKLCSPAPIRIKACPSFFNDA